MERTIRNARIKGTQLGYGDRGILTAWVILDYGASGQDLGGYAFDRYDENIGERVPTELCGIFIQELLEVVGVEWWEDLKGQYVRVDASLNKVHRIGNLLKEKWFDVEECMEKYKKEALND